MIQSMIQRTLDWLLIAPQYLLPHHLLSRLVFVLMRLRWRGLKNLQIRWFQRQYQVDMSTAKISDIEQFACFNEFFTRELRPEARPLVNIAGQLACPVDGTVNQIGTITADTVFQAKGHEFSVTTLLGGSPHRAEPFLNGQFATLYLSPKDYHRIHCPLDAQLVETVYIPGRLFNVGLRASRVIPGLFARNERLVCVFKTEAGPMAVVLVGAIFVSSMATTWAGTIAPKSWPVIRRFTEGNAPRLKRGEELGRFNMGSTVIVLTTAQVAWNSDLQTGKSIQMGQCLGTVAAKGFEQLS